MTVICSGGTSSAKPGFAQAIYIAPAAVAALLNNIPTPWAVGLAAYIGSRTYDAATFCTTDPPAVPTFTASDIANLINPFNPFTYVPAQEKFQQLVDAFAWYQFCQCDTVTTPAPPTAPSEPSGAPDVNPPSFPPTTASPCLTVERTVVVSAANTNAPIIGTGAQGSATGAVSLPSGYTRVELDWDISNYSGSAASWQFQFNAFNAAGTFVDSAQSTFVIPPGSAHVSHTATLANGQPVTYKVVAEPGSITAPVTAHVLANFYCSGNTPTTPAAPCCPPDTTTATQIQLILDMVTLIQRQIAPFAFIDGPAHTGLTASGEITISDPLIGVRVDLTTVPARAGLIVGDPDRRFDAGYVSLGDADGWFGTVPIDTDNQLWQPRWSGAVTKIGYSLTPGVVATITELRREP